MSKKLSYKDKEDWKNFISSNDKLSDKDKTLIKNKDKEFIKKIDLHGLSLENANKTIHEFIEKCFLKKVNKIIVITGKGLRSKNESNPYVSKDLSILKNSVPEYIKNNSGLMKKIKNISDADIKDGGSGAFYIFLKKKL